MDDYMKKDLAFWADEFEDKRVQKYGLSDILSHLYANDLSINQIDQIFRIWAETYSHGAD